MTEHKAVEPVALTKSEQEIMRHALLKSVQKIDSVRITVTEYEQLKADAERYRCLCNMATRDYERSAQYQFVGKLNEFVDDIKPTVDEAIDQARGK